MTARAPRNPHRWALWAKAQDYPICVDCCEPIVKGDWKQSTTAWGDRCSGCWLREQRARDRLRADEEQSRCREGWE